MFRGHIPWFSHWIQPSRGPPGLSDPFSMASDFQAKLEEEAERRRRGGAPQGARIGYPLVMSK